jgi:hypothetical protein
VADVKPGDVVLYAAGAREKGIKKRYYACEIVAGTSDGIPVSHSGQPITGARAIYRRSSADGDVPQSSLTERALTERALIERGPEGPGEEARLRAELARIFGPGELISGFACRGGPACCLRASRTARKE